MAVAFFIFEWFLYLYKSKKRGEVFAQIVIEKAKRLCAFRVESQRFFGRQQFAFWQK